MEERKIVKSGMFSYTVALPKEWITRHKLNKGHKVFFEEHEGSLILSPQKTKTPLREKGERTLNVNGMQPSSVVRDIIACYLTNTGTLRLIGSDLKKNISLYKDNISQLAGFEVIEETGDSILIRDFINVEELIIPDIIRRTDNIIRSLFEDTLECLQSGDRALADAIRQRDRDINRLVFLTSKCLNHINDHPQEGKIHGIESQSCSTHLWELNGYLEKIGDEVKRFASKIPDAKLSAKEKKEIESIFKEIYSFYLGILSSLYKGSVLSADESSAGRHDIRKRCNNFIALTKSVTATTMANKMVYMISFINSISRIVRYILFDKHMVVKGPITSDRNV
jgi:phosphate uptake regulator